jgi:hypothetical protein
MGRKVVNGEGGGELRCRCTYFCVTLCTPKSNFVNNQQWEVHIRPKVHFSSIPFNLEIVPRDLEQEVAG